MTWNVAEHDERHDRVVRFRGRIISMILDTVH